jgi:hypothetical protein
MSLALGTPDQRQDQDTIDQPIDHERERYDQEERIKRGKPCAGIKPKCSEGTGYEDFAIRQIHDPCDSVLKLQPHRHQGVGAAEQESDDDDVHN